MNSPLTASSLFTDSRDTSDSFIIFFMFYFIFPDSSVPFPFAFPSRGNLIES